MIIGSRSSNFIFNFPKNFILDSIEEKYAPYIKRMPLPYDTVLSVMNANVQSVTFPGLAMEPVEQTRKYGLKQNYKNAVPLSDLYTRDMSVTIRSLDGYINYWIMQDNAIAYLNLGEKAPLYLEDLHIRFLDQEGHVVNTTRFSGIVLTGISEIQTSYSDNNPEFHDFTLSFRFNIINIEVEKD